MSWLSIGTKVIPKLFKGGTTATSTLWKGTTAVTEASFKLAGTMLKHPKTSIAGGIGAYAGWKMLDNKENAQINSNDKTFGTHFGETTKDAVNKVADFAHDAVNGFTGDNTVEKVTDTATTTLDNLNQNVSETKGLLGTIGDSLSGIGKFLGNIFGGSGMNMFGNFFRNIASGHISGLSIGALIAGGYLLFGRSGILGKIGGALLAMMMIGSNSQQQTNTQQQAVAQSQDQDQQRGFHR